MDDVSGGDVGDTLQHVTVTLAMPATLSSLALLCCTQNLFEWLSDLSLYWSSEQTLIV